MKPYYEHGGITIYHGDCREILPGLPKVDLCLTDPPYGLGFDKEHESMSCGMRKDGSKRKYNAWSNPQPVGYHKGDWDQEKPDASVFDLIFTASDKQIIWGGNYFPLPQTGGWLVWDKMVTMTTLSKCELAWTSFMGHIEIKHYLWAGFRKQKPEFREHTTQKPLELMSWCIGFTPEVKTIIDPFMGSGTTLRAAKDAGMQCIGIEKEEQHCESAARRLQQEVLL